VACSYRFYPSFIGSFDYCHREHGPSAFHLRIILISDAPNKKFHRNPTLDSTGSRIFFVFAPIYT
jgi:hypothetical protein